MRQEPQQIQTQLMVDSEVLVNTSSIRIFHRGKEIGMVNKESLISLYDGYVKGKLKKEINEIRLGKKDYIKFSQIKEIFGDRWFLIFADAKKIEEDFEKPDSENTMLLTNERGSVGAYVVKVVSEWYKGNIEYAKKPQLPRLTGNLKEDIQIIKSFLNFDIDEYRSLEKDSPMYDYLVEKIDSKYIYVFRAYNYSSVLPINIRGTNFEGMTVSLNTGERALVLAQRFDFYRKITTLLALLYSIIKLNSTQGQSGQGDYFEITDKHYEFVGNFLLEEHEVVQMRESIKGYPALKKYSKKYGISSEYLLRFLFKDFDDYRYNEIYSQINEIKNKNKGKEKKGGPNWNVKERFIKHYSPELLKQKRDKLNKDPRRFLKPFAKQMITTGDTVADKVVLLKEVMS